MNHPLAIHTELVAGIPPLSALPAGHLRQLLGVSYQHTLPSGMALVAEGRVTDSAFVLLDGAIEMSAALGAEVTVYAIRRAPPALCVLTAMMGESAVAGFSTCTPSRVLFVPGVALRAALCHVPFVDAVLALTLGEQRDALESLKNRNLRSGLERLAAWLAEVSAGRRRFKLPYEKRRIARLLGMTPENLTRTFAALSRYGVRVQGEWVNVSDPLALRRVARADPDNKAR